MRLLVLLSIILSGCIGTQSSISPLLDCLPNVDAEWDRLESDIQTASARLSETQSAWSAKFNNPHGDPLIEINSASTKALETLPGIGPVLAGRIISFRQIQRFKTTDDLRLVKGIGVKKLEKIAFMIYIER